MNRSYCYLSMLRARGGTLRGVASMSPLARSRTMMLFDIPPPKPEDVLENYLIRRADEIRTAWGRTRPVYVDVHDLPLDLRTTSGISPITYIFDSLRMYGIRAIPVTGSEADRGRDYLTAVRAIVAEDKQGLCFRLVEEDFEDANIFRSTIANTLAITSTEPSQVDVIVDFRYIGNQGASALRGTTLDTLEAILSVGEFRNIVVAGGSVPDVLGKSDHGKIRHEPRVEFDLWTQLTATLGSRVPVAFGDYGIVSPYYVPPGKPVHVPARIRYTTPKEHAFYRADRSEYSKICKQLTASTDFTAEDFSVGDHYISQCAKGFLNSNNAADWVANDVNHHLELVSQQIYRHLEESRLLSRFSLPEPERLPWLQVELV